MYRLSPRFITSSKVNKDKLYLIDIESDKDQFIELDGDLVKIFTEISMGKTVEAVSDEYPEDQRPEIHAFIKDMLEIGILIKKD